MGDWVICFGSGGLFRLINLNITGGWEASLNQHKLKITSELITTANWTKQTVLVVRQRPEMVV